MLVFDKSNKSNNFINASDRVFRVSSKKNNFSANMFEPRIAISCKAELKIGSPLHIEFETENCMAQLDGDIVESARTKAVSVDEVKEHIDRLGQSPFVLKDISVNLDENVGISFSQLHNIRARCLQLLEQKLLDSYSASKNTYSSVKIKNHKVNHKVAQANVFAIATNPDTARVAKRSGASKVYVPFYNYKLGGAVYAGKASAEAGQATYPKDTVIMQPTVYAVVEDDMKLHFCDNLSAVYSALQNGSHFEVGPHVPIVNVESASYFAELGASRI